MKRIYEIVNKGKGIIAAIDPDNLLKIYDDEESGGYTPDASETVKGKIQIATEAQRVAGSNDTTAITPLKLKATADEVTEEAANYSDNLVNNLLDGVSTPGNTLLKLYNLILGVSAEEYVANTAARDAYDIPHLPFSLFVTDDGDGKWAKYQATTIGVGATFVKISDPDLLNAVMSAFAIKTAYESNSDTNAFTNALKTLLLQQSGTNTGDQDLTALEPKTVQTTGSVISFSTRQRYNSIASPTSGNITDNLTGARTGVVQKIFSNRSTTPTFPSGWVKRGSGNYIPSTLNIIYAEWEEGTTVSYWITQ